MLDTVWRSKPDHRKVLAGHAGVVDPKDLLFLKRLVEAGQVEPVIDRRYPLEQIVEAHARVETRRKRGSVVIVGSHDDRASSRTTL